MAGCRHAKGVEMRFSWEPDRLAALHRQRHRRGALLHVGAIPLLCAAALAWLVLQAGSAATLWRHAPGPAVALVALAAAWPFHVAWLQERRLRPAARRGAGDWRLVRRGELIEVEHAGLRALVPLESLGPARLLPAGSWVPVRHAHLEWIPVPAAAAADLEALLR